MAKHLIDIDEGALISARSRLGTSTIKDTVNESLRRASGAHAHRVADALDVLAAVDPGDRDDAWR